MSSILTNNGAMVALQTMKSINSNMEKTQSAIATGKDVANSKDNAAVWAISKVMESDVGGFKAISDNLGLGQATTSVARQAAETTTDLLKQMKEKIIAAQGENVDRGKIQADITELRNQITSVTNAAQFNGLNLLQGYDSSNVLSSLDRSSSGVSPSSITVDKQDLTTTAAVAGTAAARAEAPAFAAAADTGGADTSVTIQVGTNGTAASAAQVTIAGVAVDFTTGANANDTAAAISAAINANTTLAEAGITSTVATNEVTLSATGQAVLDGFVAPTDTGGDNTLAISGALAEGGGEITLGTEALQSGDTFTLDVDGTEYSVVANTRMTSEDVLTDLAEQINEGTAAVAEVRNGSLFVADTAGTALAMTASSNSGGTAAGGLNALTDIDVSNFDDVVTAGMSTEDRAAAIRGALEADLASIESMIQTGIDASAAFGSVENRIEIQQDFVSGMMDALKSGIGTLVDANMEEQSARLQALQVQQQLGVQALSIANQAPQQLLSLFR